MHTHVLSPAPNSRISTTWNAFYVSGCVSPDTIIGLRYYHMTLRFSGPARWVYGSPRIIRDLDQLLAGLIHLPRVSSTAQQNLSTKASLMEQEQPGISGP